MSRRRNETGGESDQARWCRFGRGTPLVRARAVALVVLLLASSCATSSHVVIDRLFFGTNIPAGGHVTDEQWSAFVKDVVTPRFRDGLTIFEGIGQWLDPRGELVREHVMVVEVAHPVDDKVDADLRAIANEYKKRFQQDAVLRTTSPAKLVFY